MQSSLEESLAPKLHTHHTAHLVGHIRVNCKPRKRLFQNRMEEVLALVRINQKFSLRESK